MTNNKKFPMLKKILASALAASVFPVTSHAAMQLEEVVVTAQKRAENIQDTTISIAAFENEAIEKMGITDVSDLDGTVPNLNLAPFPASRSSLTSFIRGVGSVDIQVTKDAAVGIYIDGVFLGRSGGLAADIADLSRIEVLRGPQGTLYGRNTTGGAINMITAKPVEDLLFKQEFGVGNRDYFLSKTMLNIPLSDTFAVRMNYQRSDEGGWVNNVGSGRDFNESDKEAYRIAARWQASDSLTVDYAYDHSELSGGMMVYQVTEALTPGFSAFVQSEPQDDLSVAGGDRGGVDDKASGHALTLEWDVSDAITFKSITAYRELDSENYYDFSASVHTFTRNTGAGLPALLSRGAQVLDGETRHDQNQFSQEFQVLGDVMDGRLRYIVGAYYFKEEGQDWQNIQNNVLALNALQQGIGSPAYGILLPAIWAGFEVDAEAESQALFGQATYIPSVLDEKLELTLGLRYTSDERKATKKSSSQDPGFANPDNFGAVVDEWAQDGKADSSRTSPSLTVTYNVNEDVRVYGKYSESYRAGGFNARADESTFNNGFDPEDLTAWELGLKSDLMDRRLRLNMAAFFYDYEDLQVDQSLPPSIGVTQTVNAGSQEIAGFEADITALISENLVLTASYGYLDGEVKEFLSNDAFCPGTPADAAPPQDVAACRVVPLAPEHSYTIALDHTWDWANVGQVSTRLQYHWEDDASFTAKGGLAVRDSYGLLNASVQLSDVRLNESWSLRAQLWGRNLTEEEFFVHAIDFRAFQLGVFNEPRSYGLSVAFEYE